VNLFRVCNYSWYYDSLSRTKIIFSSWFFFFLSREWVVPPRCIYSVYSLWLPKTEQKETELFLKLAKDDTLFKLIFYIKLAGWLALWWWMQVVIVTSEEERDFFVKEIGEEVLPEEYGGRAMLVAPQDVTVPPLEGWSSSCIGVAATAEAAYTAAIYGWIVTIGWLANFNLKHAGQCWAVTCCDACKLQLNWFKHEIKLKQPSIMVVISLVYIAFSIALTTIDSVSQLFSKI